RSVLTGSGDSGVSLWSVETGKEIRHFVTRKGGAAAVAFSPDGRFILTGADKPYTDDDRINGIEKKRWEQGIGLWDVANGKETRHFDGFSPVAFSPDGKVILSAGGGKDKSGAQLWNVSTGEKTTYFKGHRSEEKESEEGNAVAVSFSPDGSSVLIALG